MIDRNFKRFGDPGRSVPLGRISLILGRNSTGNATIFQALLALQQTWEADGSAAC